MTAIATVLAHLRLARLTPYLLALLAAVVACLLLGNHTAFAGERGGSQPAGAHLEAVPGHEVERARQPRAEEAAAQPDHQQAARVERPAGPPPAVAPVHQQAVRVERTTTQSAPVAAPVRQQAAQVDRPAGPPPVAVPVHEQAAPVERPKEPPPVAASASDAAKPASDRPAHREPSVERPPAPAGTRPESEVGTRSGPPLTMLTTAAGPSAATVAATAEPLSDLPVQALSAARPRRPAPVTAPGEGGSAAPATRHARGILGPPRSEQKAGLENPDRDDAAAQPPRQSGGNDESAPVGPTPAPAPETARTTAPKTVSQAACLPPSEESRESAPAPPQVHRARTHGSAGGVASRLSRASVRPFRQPGIALVARPMDALAPILSMSPPAIEVPAPSTLLPNPPAPAQSSQPAEPRSALPAAHQAALNGNSPVARLQSAVTVGALWLLVPLLALVLLLQVRLMRQMRSLTGAPAPPAPRYYSLTHEEARELVPDMLPALAHHRFCETERHQGRWRPARWIELEDNGSEPLLMWATCETCHHQRMTRLRSGREVAISRQ